MRRAGAAAGARAEEAKNSSDDMDYVERDDVLDDLKKEEIDIMADDTVPLKKGKTNNQMMAMTSDRSGIEKALNRSNISQSQLDRSSVKSSISRKRGAVTVEEYIADKFGMQFTELVLLLSAEQQAEDSLEDTTVNH